MRRDTARHVDRFTKDTERKTADSQFIKAKVGETNGTYCYCGREAISKGSAGAKHTQTNTPTVTVPVRGNTHRITDTGLH